MSGKFKGFTLIELLIVVAIIAILAAIAVPNFLEAQVRAKVSRVMADTRSEATALETYRIDFNNYPPAWEYWPAGPGRTWGTFTEVPGGPFHSRIPSYITTPVAYMSSIPNDPFMQKLNNNLREVSLRHIYFNYTEFAQALGTNSMKGRRDQTGGYMFYSFGPDNNDNQAGGAKPGLQGTYTRYDASNGTVSFGNVIRTAASADGFIPYSALVSGSQNGPN